MVKIKKPDEWRKAKIIKQLLYLISPTYFVLAYRGL